MKYPEEGHATKLHKALSRRFWKSAPPTELSVSGAGVHWNCEAHREISSCRIVCFDTRGAEYYTSFSRDSDEAATARTSSRKATIDAVADWLDGADLSALYAAYPFVDQRKRELTAIREQVIELRSELGGASAEIICEMADCYRLRFRGDSRSCEISFWGKNQYPDARFSWDDCQLFEFQADDNRHLAAVLSRWICDQAMPSAIRSEFPEIEIGELADFYEKGNPIEGEFITSWNWMERFYDDMDYDWVPLAKKLIFDMRGRGYDRTLRAGQSLWSLILSRSRRHGLREEQPAIQFWFSDEGMGVHHTFDRIGSEPKPVAIELTDEIDRLLQRLQSEPID